MLEYDNVNGIKLVYNHNQIELFSASFVATMLRWTLAKEMK